MCALRVDDERNGEVLQAFPPVSALSAMLAPCSLVFYEFRGQAEPTSVSLAPVGDLWEATVTAVAAALVGWSVGGRLFGWSRCRCEEARAAARLLPLPSKRTLVGVARGCPTARARVRVVPSPQQAFENERRDGDVAGHGRV